MLRAIILTFHIYIINVRKKEITSFESHTNNSLRPGKRAERSIMTNTFVKLGNGMIINVNSVDGIFPNTNRAYNGGYTIQLNGKDFHLDSKDAQSVFDTIGIYPDERPSRSIPFNPDKRITPATTTDNFPKMANKIKAIVDDYNKDHHLERVTTEVDRIKKSVKIKASAYTYMLIEDGIITEDEMGGSRFSEMKSAINSILIEG